MDKNCKNCNHRDGENCEIWKSIKRAAKRGPCDLWEPTMSEKETVGGLE